MSTLTMRNAPADNDLPLKILKQLRTLLHDLQLDNESGISLLREVKDAVDPRVRVASVDDDSRYAAILYVLSAEGLTHYVYTGTKLGPDAVAEARISELWVDPRTGVTSIRTKEQQVPPAPPAEPAAPPTQQETPAPEPAKSPEKAPSTPRSPKVSRPTPVPAAPVTVSLNSPKSALAPYTAQHLEQQLGISTEAFNVARALESEDELDAALQDFSTWETDALMALVAGMSIDDIRADLALGSTDEKHEAPASEDDTDTVQGLKKASSEFHYVGTDTEAMRRVIDDGNFNKWRVFLHPAQQQFVDRQYNGSARVTGGAGTGKTVVVLHRTNMLLNAGNKQDPDKPAVFLTTYTRGLADSLRSQMAVLNPGYFEAEKPGSPGLWISGIDALAQKILKEAEPEEVSAAIEKVTGASNSKMPGPLSGDDERKLWQESLGLVDTPPEGEFAQPTFLAQEYESVILAQKITDPAQYRKATRTGRGASMGRSERKKVWSVIDRFHLRCRTEGRYTFAALAAMASEILESRVDNGQDHLFDHVLIDEAQDFHAGHWRLLRACVGAGPNDIFLAEDSHQRIYGQKITLSRFDISTRGRSRRLTVNYRTTRQNLSYASQMLLGEEWVDSEGESDSLTGYRSVRSGPAPAVAQCASLTEEIDAAAEAIHNWQQENKKARVGILVRSRRMINQIIAGLAEHEIQAVDTKNASKAAESEVAIMTMHGAKGMEFTHVILMGVNSDALPMKLSLRGLNDHDRADAIQRERALLYVAASRARDQLMITYTGEGSVILPS